MAKRIEIEPETATATEAWTPRNFLRKCYEHSPWLTISVLLHVLIFTLFAIVRPDKASPRIPDWIPDISAAPAEEKPLLEVPPDREVREVPPEELEGHVNPNPEYTPQMPPGRPGEPTEDMDPFKDPGEFNPDPEASVNLLSGATGSTPIGVGVYGHFGKTSPWAGRGGGGPGGGGGGQNGENGIGGTKTEDSVRHALNWLHNHQSPDGHWDAASFSDLCKGTPCDGPGQSAHNTGVTGLALLCFLGDGQTHLEGTYKQTVLKGVKYLIDHQDEDGCFGERVGKNFLYDHACAALAVTEAYGMTKTRAFAKPAQQGINFILRAQNPYGAWRYSFPPDGDNDTSVTGWMVMVLKSAQMSELKIDEQAYANAMNFITEMTDPDTGRTGYTERGSAPSRLNEMVHRFPPERSESLTAVGMLVRIFAQHEIAKSDPLLQLGSALCAAKPPEWDLATGDIDFYYWYYATLAMFQVGGPGWAKWNAALKTACIDHQRTGKDQCALGSWDAVDPWSSAGGRVYSTAMNCLCMEVYYRYPRVFGMR